MSGVSSIRRCGCEFLLSGFGWCNMPLHMVEEHIAAGRLRRLEILHGEPPPEFPLYVVCPRDRPLGRAGRWLVARPARAAEILPDLVPEHAGRGMSFGTLSRRLRSHSPASGLDDGKAESLDVIIPKMSVSRLPLRAGRVSGNK